MDEYLGVIRVLNFIKEWIEMRRSELEQVLEDTNLSEYVRGKLEMLDELEKVVDGYRNEMNKDIERIIKMLRAMIGDENE